MNPLLSDIAFFVDGEVIDGNSIMIRTWDTTSKENYDDLLQIVNDIEDKFPEADIEILWADHDTQIIEFNI